MNDIIEVFDGVKNIEFKELTQLEDVKAEFPVFTLKEKEAEEWNKKARIQNTKMFSEVLNRQPKDYQEVLTWVYGFIPGNEKSHSDCGTVTFA
jgi:hypothetical protein